MYVVTWDDLNTEADRIANKWAGKVSSVYGVPTGGVPVALLVSQRLGIPVAAEWTLGQRILVVDDLIDTGRTLAKYEQTEYIDVCFRKPWSPMRYASDAREINDWLWFPWEHDEGDPHDAIVRLLQFIGEDPTRDGLIETPARVTKAYKELTKGYDQDPAEILSKTFDVHYDELIILSGVPYWSLCEHHMLPFWGKATIGYIPKAGQKIVGLSKLARLVECYSRRLQVQERMTNQIAEALEEHLAPFGVGVVINGMHTCMAMRGIERQGTMTTSKLTGQMRKNDALRSEFLTLAHNANK
jgi:GTP cyclohydrolase I